jgi:hypothetical protein
MPNKSIPTLGDSNWGTPLNNHLSQLLNPSTGGINLFDKFLDRPLASALTLDDTGKTYLYTQTGNIHQWNGTVWKILNESVINIKDYGAVGDGVVDDTVSIKSAITLAKTLIKPLFIPAGNFLVSSTLEVSAIEVYGNDKYNCIIKATSAQFHVFKTTGETRFRNFRINGSWDKITAGQTGNSIFLDSPVGVSSKVFISDMIIENSKENAIRLNRAAYSHISGVYSLESGLNGVYMFGSGTLPSGFNDSCTTVDINNSSTFSNCPNGFGVKFENCINVTLNGVISEVTKGFGIFGNDNRTINFNNCYQENTIGQKFITWAGAGIMMNIFGCFGGGATLDYYEYYYGVNFLGNILLLLSTPNCYNWNMVQDNSSSTTISGLKQILGVNSKNTSGGTPAHILDTSPMSGSNKSILELRNNGATQMRVDSDGGVYTPRLHLGNYTVFVDPTNGKLLIKNGIPTAQNDGDIVGTQS